MLPVVFDGKVVEEGLDDLGTAGPGGPASDLSLTVQVDVVGHARDVVVAGNTRLRVEDVLEGKAAVVNKALGLVKGSVELGDAHNLDAKVSELAFVESLDSGQLPLAVGSPVRPEYDEGRGTSDVGDLEVVARHGGRGEVWGVRTLVDLYGGLT